MANRRASHQELEGDRARVSRRKQNADRWNIAYLQKTTLPYEDNYLHAGDCRGPYGGSNETLKVPVTEQVRSVSDSGRIAAPQQMPG
jgi:hypothetical protein